MTPVVSTRANYRWLAPWYSFCEQLIFGQALQNCRTAFLDELPNHVLSVGEGDGRFAQAFLASKPMAKLTIIEPDAAMREAGQKRAPDAQWLTNWSEVHRAEAIVMNFILDCFTEKEATEMIQKAQKALAPNGMLIVGDFFPTETQSSWDRPMAQALVWVMYRFFHTIAGENVTKLPPIRRLLENSGWRRVAEKTQWAGFIRSQKWQPTTPPEEKPLLDKISSTVEALSVDKSNELAHQTKA